MIHSVQMVLLMLLLSMTRVYLLLVEITPGGDNSL